jgi:hypothetical protein
MRAIAVLLRTDAERFHGLANLANQSLQLVRDDRRLETGDLGLGQKPARSKRRRRSTRMSATADFRPAGPFPILANEHQVTCQLRRSTKSFDGAHQRPYDVPQGIALPIRQPDRKEQPATNHRRMGSDPDLGV